MDQAEEIVKIGPSLRYWRALVWSAEFKNGGWKAACPRRGNSLTILVDFGSYSWATDDVKYYRA